MLSDGHERVLASQRHERILRLLEEEGHVTTDRFLSQLGVSKMTLWRDLRQLDQAGLLQKVHGGAVQANGSVREEPHMGEKALEQFQSKKRLAEHAARTYVEEGSILILDGSPTVAHMVFDLGNASLTLLTNGLRTLTLASRLTPTPTIIASGGILRFSSLTFVGPEAEDFFRKARADTLFICGEGITAPGGVTDVNPLDITVKRLMMERAKRVVFLMDSKTFGKESFASLASFDEIDVLVTDDGAPEEMIRMIHDRGVRVDVVGVDEERSGPKRETGVPAGHG